MNIKSDMTLFRKLQKLSLLIGAMTIAVPILFWNRIPEQIPLHYNSSGLVDNWSDKSSLVLLFLAIVLLMGMMSIAVYFVKTNMDSKYSSNCERSEMNIVYPMLIVMNLVLQIMFAYIMFCVTTCRRLGPLFLPIFLIGTFAPIAYMIYKCGRVREASGDQNAIYKKMEKQEQGITYRTAVDWWLGGLLIGSEFMMIWYAIEPIIKKGEISWSMILITVGTSIFILPLFAIKYVMYSDHMLISMSIYGKERVRYEDIVGMKETLNPLSSAALSIKRIQIDYVENGTHRMILISPVRRKEFYKDLYNSGKLNLQQENKK